MENASQQPAAHPLADVVSVYLAAKETYEQLKAEAKTLYAAGEAKRTIASQLHEQRAIAEYKYWALFIFARQVLKPLSKEHQALSERRYYAEEELKTAGTPERLAELAIEIRGLTVRMEAYCQKGLAIQKAQLESIGDSRDPDCALDSQHLIWFGFELTDARKAEETAKQEIEQATEAWRDALHRELDARKVLEAATKAMTAAAEKYALEQQIAAVVI